MENLTFEVFSHFEWNPLISGRFMRAFYAHVDGDCFNKNVFCAELVDLGSLENRIHKFVVRPKKRILPFKIVNKGNGFTVAQGFLVLPTACFEVEVDSHFLFAIATTEIRKVLLKTLERMIPSIWFR